MKVSKKLRLAGVTTILFFCALVGMVGVARTIALLCLLIADLILGVISLCGVAIIIVVFYIIIIRLIWPKARANKSAQSAKIT